MNVYKYATYAYTHPYRESHTCIYIDIHIQKYIDTLTPTCICITAAKNEHLGTEELRVSKYNV